MSPSTDPSFESLANAAIEGDATDAQLEALESAILANDNGADRLRDLAEEAFAGAVPDMSPIVSVSEASAEMPDSSGNLRRIVFGLFAAASTAAAVAILAVGLFWFYQTKKPVVVEHLPADVAEEMLAAADVPEEKEEAFPIGAVVVPEPSTAFLLLSSSLWMILRRRRCVVEA